MMLFINLSFTYCGSKKIKLFKRISDTEKQG